MVIRFGMIDRFLNSVIAKFLLLSLSLFGKSGIIITPVCVALNGIEAESEVLFLGKVLYLPFDYWPQGGRTQHYWLEIGGPTGVKDATYYLCSLCASALTAFYISSKSLIFLKVGQTRAEPVQP